MKLLTPITIFLSVILSSATCNKANTSAKCYKGRLEIKGLCMNYVIKVLDGNTSALNIAKTWVDESTDKTYENVFALGSRCNFPDIAEGEEFYFTIDENSKKDCNVCMAYRPVPKEANSIAVIKTACK
jgi:hypothetical protein